jgi:hypothetical protein
MKKPAERLSMSCRILIIMYVVHGFHRMLYPEIGKFVVNGNKITMKSPVRIDFFKNKIPDMPFQPTPVLTCWGNQVGYLCVPLLVLHVN